MGQPLMVAVYYYYPGAEISNHSLEKAIHSVSQWSAYRHRKVD